MSVHFRILYVNSSDESIKAVKILRHNKIRFSKAQVDLDSKEFTDDKLPLLITGEGPGWAGLDAIKRYTRRTVKMSKKNNLSKPL
jgi:hypothetical protein